MKTRREVRDEDVIESMERFKDTLVEDSYGDG